MKLLAKDIGRTTTPWGDVHTLAVCDTQYHASLDERPTPWGLSRHLRVYRPDGTGDIPWDDLWAIKNALLGDNAVAIEIYPPTDQLVYESNMRHLWLVPSGCLGGYEGMGFGDL